MYSAWAQKEHHLHLSSETKLDVRHVSAFLHFCSEQREAVKGEKAGMNVGEVTKALSEKWRALDEAGKQKYVDIAAADKERYEREKKDAPEPAPKKPAAPIEDRKSVV